MIQPIPVQPTNKFTQNTPHFLLESLNKTTDVGINKIVIRSMIAKKISYSIPYFKYGCPTRIRTWVEGVKVLSATTTPPGNILIYKYKAYDIYFTNILLEDISSGP